MVLAGLALLSGLNPAAGRHPLARIVLGPGGHHPDARAAAAQQCADPYPAIRDPANPLDLPARPGPNPHRRLRHNRRLAHKVALLEKIADQPEAQRFSLYSAGGGSGAVFAQVEKIFCHNMTADRGTIPIITTYFLYQVGYCETRSEIISHRPTFERQVNEMVSEARNANARLGPHYPRRPY